MRPQNPHEVSGPRPGEQMQERSLLDIGAARIALALN
jgi:hypothetical protein